MRTLLQRLLSLTRIRGSDAAGGGRRWESDKTIGGLNGAILAGATMAARRAGWYARNNPWVAAAEDGLVGNVVGAGIKPQSTHPDRAVRERLQALWLRWADLATPDGLADFYGLQAMTVRAMIESGERFARLRVLPEASSIRCTSSFLIASRCRWTCTARSAAGRGFGQASSLTLPVAVSPTMCCPLAQAIR